MAFLEGRLPYLFGRQNIPLEIPRILRNNGIEHEFEPTAGSFCILIAKSVPEDPEALIERLYFLEYEVDKDVNPLRRVPIPAACLSALYYEAHLAPTLLKLRSLTPLRESLRPLDTLDSSIEDPSLADIPPISYVLDQLAFFGNDTRTMNGARTIYLVTAQERGSSRTAYYLQFTNGDPHSTIDLPITKECARNLSRHPGIPRHTLFVPLRRIFE